MSVPFERRVFTADEVYRMLDAGILTEDDRLELVLGELIKMSPIGRSHAACVDRLNALFNRICGVRVIVRVQNPVRLDEYSEPQPDIALLRPRGDFYALAPPTPDDTLRIVEVADSSTEYDRGVKVPLYAPAGVPVVWLVDLKADVIEVYSQPSAGAYQELQIVRRGDCLTLASLFDLVFPVDDILG